MERSIPGRVMSRRALLSVKNKQQKKTNLSNLVNHTAAVTHGEYGRKLNKFLSFSPFINLPS